MSDVSITATRPRAAEYRTTAPANASLPDYGWWVGGGMILSLALLTAMMRIAGLSIDPYDADNMPFYVSGIGLFALRFGLRDRPWRHARAIADCAEYYGVFTLLALMGAVASYPVAAMTHGFHDAALQRIDALLQFDWLAWYRLVAATPILQSLGLAAYRSIYLTPVILFATFAFTGDRVAAHRFLATFWLTAIGTLILYAFMPAIGPFSYLWHGPIAYMPESEQWQQGLIPALRDHSVRVVDLGHLRGIVSAPSFHAAAATLYINAAWRLPRLRWPVVAINTAMLLSTPVEGTHYLIDIILGTVVALAAIGVLHRIMPRERAGVVPMPDVAPARRRG
ncbi:MULTISPECIES: phosphatase PAP2 family protein [unclassified Sphingomonas]|uniref:phosphatase PAP2 family protein n=1 Tax=unclassified Sphingomonas TaxID=196159 RepID=UPI0009E6FDEC|nr:MULTISPECIES: phosphatase PAP2 family protein [unclassified Sphingomonas]